MQRSRLVFLMAALVAVADAQLARAQEYKLIYSWMGTSGIFEPGSPMTMDSHGNLYGTLAGGVFELSPPAEAGGQWTEQVLIDSTGTERTRSLAWTSLRRQRQPLRGPDDGAAGGRARRLGLCRRGVAALDVRWGVDFRGPLSVP